MVIAGGGLVGLSAAMFLANMVSGRSPSSACQRDRACPAPAHFHLRTLELFRLAGVEDQVKAQSEREFLPEGAIVMMDSLAGRKLADVIPSLNEGVGEVSPCRRLFVTQPGLEPILRARAEQAGAVVVEGHDVVDARQDAHGVTVTARDISQGRHVEVRGRYLIGADGAHSTLRELLQVPFDGSGAFSNSITIYFSADLRPQMAGKALSVVYINNETFGGFFRLDKRCESGFLVVNTVGTAGAADRAEPAADTSVERLVELVRVGAGVPDLDVRIDGLARWRATADVARSYQDGRIFLAGDAAHLMPPNGGFGGNTGIQDAHNLAWKLAYVLAGTAAHGFARDVRGGATPGGPVHRRAGLHPLRPAYRAVLLGVDEAPPLAPDFNVELGYLYRSRAIISADDDRVHADPRSTRGRPGSRAPHVWVEIDGRRVSTIDLAANTFTVFTGHAGGAWSDAARTVAARHHGLVLHVHDIGDTEAFGDAFGVSESGAVLVRPDGFVAWRAPSLPDDATGALARVLRTVLSASA